MFCPKCGQEVNSNGGYCKRCGYQLKAEVNPEQSNDKKKKRSKKKIIVGAIAGLVIVSAIIVAVFYVSGVQKEKKYVGILNNGQKYMEEELYEQAIDSYKEAIRISPKQIEPYRNLANAYLAINDSDSAEKTYTDVMTVVEDIYKEKKELPEGGTEVYEDVINYYGEKGDTEKVEELTDDVISMINKEDEKEKFEQLKDTYLMNWAYYNKLLELQKKYGDGEKKYSSIYAGDYLTGLCFAELLDMNGDNQEELVLIYGNQEDRSASGTVPAYVEEVWEYKNNQIQNVYQGKVLKTDDAMMTTSYITRKNSVAYITVGQEGYRSKYEIYGYEGENFECIKTIESDENLNYKIDNKIVSSTEFDSELQQWVSQDAEYDLSCGTEKENQTLQELRNTFTTLKNRLNITEEYSDGESGKVMANIPSNAVEYQGHHYYLYELENITSGADAETYCESQGGYLATITSADENDFLFKYIQGLGYSNAHFGFTDSEKEGEWKWVTGENVTYTNWHSGEPNGENEDEDYAMFYFKYEDGTWNDGDFDGKTVDAGNAFICEWEE